MYGHVKRMSEERLIRKILEGFPLGKRRKGRPRNSWMQELITRMRDKRIKCREWTDREEWRKKIKLKLQAQEDVKTLIHCK